MTSSGSCTRLPKSTQSQYLFRADDAGTFEICVPGKECRGPGFLPARNRPSPWSLLLPMWGAKPQSSREVRCSTRSSKTCAHHGSELAIRCRSIGTF